MADHNATARKIVGDYVVSVYGVPSLSIYAKVKGEELVQTIEKAIKEESDEERRKREHILGLLRNTKMEHGICKPRSRKACTACNSQEELDKILAEWKGFTMELS